MQSLEGREVAADVLRAAITSATVAATSWGVDLLDLGGNVTGDLTADAEACVVAYNGDDDVHRTLDITVTRALDWPKARVRPWQEILGVRFYQGLFSLETPEAAQQDGTFKVDGYDPLAGLRRNLRNSYTVPTGVSVTQAMRDAITASGLTGVAVNIDSAKDDVVTPGPMVWALLLSAPATWLRVVNDLGTAIAYRGIWADELGSLRTVPYRPPSERPVEWVLDRTDPATDIVSADVTVTVDNWTSANWWRGVRRGMSTRPVEGDGQVTLDLSGDDQQDPQLAEFDAADQASLQSQFDAWVASQTQRTTTIDVTLGPLPVLGHRDIVQYRDPSMDVKCQILTWEQDLAAGTAKASLEVVDG